MPRLPDLAVRISKRCQQSTLRRLERTRHKIEDSQELTMAPSRSSASWLSSTLAVLAIICLSVPANALYFYTGEKQTKCFFEELPKDTLVVGMLTSN